MPAPYAELHCRTYFSFLDGASSPEELIARAAALGLSALAVTDVNGLYGVVEAREALLDRFGLMRRDEEGRAPLRLLYGSELHLEDDGTLEGDGNPAATSSPRCPASESGGGPGPGGAARRVDGGPDRRGGGPAAGGAGRSAAPPGPETDVVVALARTREGYGRLSALISRGRLAAEKGSCRLTTADLCEAAGGSGLVLLAGGPRSRAMRLLRRGERAAAARLLLRLREAFGENLYVELVRHRAPGDLPRSRAMAALARDLGLPVVATNDVHFHEPSRKPLHDLLRCIRDGVTLHEAGRRLLPNAEAHLKSGREMAALFRDLPEAVAAAGELAAAIGFRLCEVTYTYPVRGVPPGRTPDDWLAELAGKGLAERLGPDGAVRYRDRLEAELALIAELGYAGYFLTMWDVVGQCRNRGILCQGRGSAANSLVCFALGITSVRPDQIDMLFERFLSRERHEPPDIDLDIEHERREEIIQYVYETYGRDHAAMVAEVIRYRRRSAVRDVGKALGLSAAQLDRLAAFLTHRWDDLDDRVFAAAGVDSKSPTVRQLRRAADRLEGFPRHLSIHVGGFVLAGRPLAETVPIENCRMEGRTVIQWDKTDVDAMGMFKVDLLGLGMLSLLARAFRLIREHRGIDLDLGRVPPDDPATYEMLAGADTVGVFQVESRAQMNMLPRLKPEKFYDLVVEVALVRPGPIQGQMVHPYLRRRRGLEPVDYPHPKLKPVLERTLGVPLFQEQVMRIAVEVGGYTPGEADQLRRDMGSWRRSGRMARHEAKLRAGMLASGIAPAFADRILEQIKGFGEYGFPESHAAAFAHLAYVSAYLKRHYPCEFTCALLNAQPMGFYSVPVIVNDAERHGVEVRPVDVQVSGWESSVEGGALRLGLHTVRGLGREAAEAIVRARAAGGPFASVEALAARAGIPRRVLVPLAAAGALRSVPDSAASALDSAGSRAVRTAAPLRAAALSRGSGAAVEALTAAGSDAREASGGRRPPAPRLPPPARLDRRRAIWLAAGVARDPGGLLAGACWREPRAELPPLTPLEEIALDYRYAGASPGRHPVALVRGALERAGVLAARDLRQMPSPPRRAAVAGLVITRQRPGAKGFVFLTLEDETGHADVAVAPGVFRRFETVIRLSPALVVHGRVVCEGAVRSIAARRFEPLDLGGEAPEIRSHDFH